ncbi:MAG: flagellar hook-associated protein FlgK [Betaproteobacteria bacterium]|nr:flagellar hook-associated protein FlgK [Candidatus Dechloromonas phosphorivorans]
MSTGLFGIGVSGLAAAQLGLLTTEHNVTNASTPGYTRQRTIQTAVVGLSTGSGAVGQGTNVATIERMYDKYLTAQVNSSQTKLSEIDTYYAEISQIDNLLADSSAGLTPVLQGFFNGVQQVAANPSLLSARQSMIASAETLVSRFNSLDVRLDELANDVNGRIEDTVSSINSYANQIAELNQRIVIAESSYGQPANDIRDQRDLLLNDLNKLIKVSTTVNSDGGISVFVGSGQPLVIGTRGMVMTANPSAADSAKMAIGFETVSGSSVELPDSLVMGGELGGLIKFRNETLGRTSNELGRMAASMALTFNAQNALGQDLLGRANGDTGFNAEFFSMTDMKPIVKQIGAVTGTPVIAVNFASPSYGPDVTNGNFYTNLSTSDYRLTNVDGTNYTLTRLSDGQALPPPPAAATNTLATVAAYAAANEGFSISLTGDAAGNSYLIQPTINAAGSLAVNSAVVSDPRTVAAALPFRTSSVITNTGTGSISGGGAIPGADLTQLPIAVSYVYTSASSGPPVVAEARELSFPLALAGETITIKLPGAAESTTALPANGKIAYTSGMEIGFSGMKFTLTGVPNNGDTFKLERNVAATTDGRNALALGKLQTQNTVAGSATGAQGTATFQTAFAEMVANIGIKTRELSVSGAAQESMLEQAQAGRDALSGVNLDEEAANMIRFQQAYQASAKILDIGSKLFDELLQLG